MTAGGAGSSDEGVATSGTLTVALVGVLALLFIATLPLLRGTEQAGRGRTAAEAAALAGAERVREHFLEELAGVTMGQLVTGLLHGEWSLQSPLPAMGYTEASTYAAANDGEVPPQWYHYDAAAGTVSVRARLLEAAPAGGHTESTAKARLGIRLSTCRLGAERDELPPPPPTPPPPSPTPTPTDGATPSPTPTPTPTPTEPPAPVYTDWELTFSCEGTTTIRGSDLGDILSEAREMLDDAARPRLVE